MARRGSLVGDAYVRIHADSSRIDNELRDELSRGATAAGKSFVENLDRIIDRESKTKLRSANQSLIRGIVGGKTEWDRQFKQSGMASTNDFARAVKHRLRELGDAASAAGRPFTGLQQALDDLDHWSRSNTDTRMQRLVRTFADGRRNAHSFGDVLGKTFGKGSRNNFLNFIGSVAGGMGKLAGLFVHSGVSIFAGGLRTLSVFGRGAFGIMSGFGQLMSGGGAGGITTAFRDLATNVGDLAKQFGGALLGALKGVVPLLAAGAAAVSLFAVALPPVLALIANLSAILISVAGAIGTGLVAGALAAIPVVVALGAGIGAAIFLFVQMNKHMKTLKDELRPLTDAWKDLQKQMSGRILEDFAKSLGAFAPLLRDVVTPVITDMAESVVGIMELLGKELNSDRFAPFLDMWRVQLPGIFDAFGTALANFGLAMIPFFAPILEFAREMADSIKGASDTFLEWVTSAEGQTAIHDWFVDAWEVASDLWGIIEAAAQALAGLATAGTENAGDTIVDKIRVKLEEFVAWINSPSGAQALVDFFDNGLDTAKTLWQTITDMSNAMKTVNWKDASDNINKVIDFIGQLIAIATTFSSMWNAYVKGIGDGWRAVGAVFSAIWVGVIAPVIDKILGAVAGVIRAIAGMLGALGTLPNMEGARVASRELYKAADAADAMGESIRNIPDANVNVNVGLSGPGVKLLQQKMMGRTSANGTVLFAAGGILSGATFIRPNVIAGEAGREAIVPLDRPLSQIDPSVRALAAYAQGTMRMGTGGTVGGGLNIESGAILVQAPYSDGRLVAESVLDAFAAAAR